MLETKPKSKNIRMQLKKMWHLTLQSKTALSSPGCSSPLALATLTCPESDSVKTRERNWADPSSQLRIILTVIIWKQQNPSHALWTLDITCLFSFSIYAWLLAIYGVLVSLYEVQRGSRYVHAGQPEDMITFRHYSSSFCFWSRHFCASVKQTEGPLLSQFIFI